MQELLKDISNYGIVPVVRIDELKDAVPLAKSLCLGGLPLAEVTFRTDCAKEAIAAMHSAYPDMILGAGTVLTTKQVDDAVEAGATFIVSPGFNGKIVEYCQSKNILIVPGCSSASDIEKALEFDLEVVKFFPAEASGGIKSIKALSAPYAHVKFMPTGGIHAGNLQDYLSFSKIVACGGSWMVDPQLVKNQDFDAIQRLTEDAIKSMLDLKLAHVGINANDENEALHVSKTMSLFNQCNVDERKASYFVGPVEVMKTPFLGKRGHIAYSTPQLERAKFFLEKRGFEFDESTISYDEKHKIKSIYAKDEIGEFAVHLVAR